MVDRGAWNKGGVPIVPMRNRGRDQERMRSRREHNTKQIRLHQGAIEFSEWNESPEGQKVKGRRGHNGPGQPVEVETSLHGGRRGDTFVRCSECANPEVTIRHVTVSVFCRARCFFSYLFLSFSTSTELRLLVGAAALNSVS